MERRLSALGEGMTDSVTLAFIDLDRFKAVNDGSGHRAGDLLLTYVAERLQEVALEGESLARIGGDELVLLSDYKDGRTIGRRLLRVFDEPFSLDGRTHVVTGSIGIATVVGPVHADELIRRADEAQYRARNDVAYAARPATAAPTYLILVVPNGSRLWGCLRASE